MTAQRRHLLITGRVQGVYFRQSALEEALRLGLRGWVRNLDGGEVEAVAEGGPEALEKFVSWCHRGPPAAKVAQVRVNEATATGEFLTFTVERDR